MKRAILIGGIILTIGAVVGSICSFRIYKNHSSVASSISIIGGADGHTSIFVAGKLGGNKMQGFTNIDMKEAEAIFKNPGNYVILDVRRDDEYSAGHIPGAINVANEEILMMELDEVIEGLEDKDKTVYVYCRSGNRSKQSAAKLVTMGYTDVVEFGGIMDWKGEIER